MPKEITDVREFMSKANSKSAKVCRIKKTPSYTKFKIRGGKYLYTLKVNNKEQAEKLIKALPVGLNKKEV
eukprot:CAMPEP_0202965234 /NCGR_PEP_ID=MMETSP1396-20130829/9281_1 /ASSEMBLY_ACC=CAM_ASM_000872 /TAXON_ID= /ORGANISM="Pseudokeronopsis sp., Strain Brazil" /LENGTH=69 /DNA_ID=CAMNT_0049687885 /DNA_START=71 /DNA_END=280 /DNA_ORIENTATION=-